MGVTFTLQTGESDVKLTPHSCVGCIKYNNNDSNKTREYKKINLGQKGHASSSLHQKHSFNEGGNDAYSGFFRTTVCLIDQYQLQTWLTSLWVRLSSVTFLLFPDV